MKASDTFFSIYILIQLESSPLTLMYFFSIEGRIMMSFEMWGLWRGTGLLFIIVTWASKINHQSLLSTFCMWTLMKTWHVLWLRLFLNSSCKGGDAGEKVKVKACFQTMHVQKADQQTIGQPCVGSCGWIQYAPKPFCGLCWECRVSRGEG